MQLSSQLIVNLEQAIQDHNIEEIKRLIKQVNHADLADVLATLSFDLQVKLIEYLPHAAYVFEFLSLEQQLEIAEQLPISQLVQLISEMHSDDRTDLFKALSKNLKNEVYAQLDPQIQQQIQQLAQYAEESAGAIMSSDFVALSPNLTIPQAIEQIRQQASDRETLYLIYIVDQASKLLGVVSLREIILAEPTKRIADIMTTDLVVGSVHEDQESIAQKLSHYDFIALPILDDEQHLLGIVTYDDAMDVAQEEMTEDFLKSSAVSSSPKMSIKTAPIFFLYKKRVFWLVILVFGSLLSGIGISHFEDIISANIVLVFFLPLLVGSGGNAGSQSATLMVRALAMGDVQLKDWMYLIGRETLVALCLGGTMAFAVSILGYIRGDAMVALVLALSMMGIVLLGCLIGMSLPFILNRLKLDPASASAPLVTSICDATGVIVYLFIASILLGQVAV
ncbi:MULTISPECIES: magnesium transporter [unclassified Acinetobacter]|uniref:magnesium transporter n=1 Tax=unclassified Acinetobacter TaxID=196816 RepID=UPI00257810D7|nr:MULTISPECIES: magnesium transporter [unclassified Acinetobacter]MDM1763489.1 magnesium transporter [Acinetobacter sp. 226-1]MDM1766968.1 magnesium transporter [Acinetobacter sp. 226-4]